VPTSTATPYEWTAPDGERFPYSQWDATTGEPRAILVAVHGLSGAAIDFEPLGRHLSGHGFTTLALELRGQGNDPKPERRGDLLRLDQWFDDLRAFIALVRQRYPGWPVFHYGESMGAALLARFTAATPLPDQPDGLVLASPVTVVPGNPSGWQQLVFRFFLFITPARRVDLSKYSKREDEEDPTKWVTRDAAHRQWFQGASHRLTSFTFRFFKCLYDLFGGCEADAPRIHAPVLVIYATHDVFIPPARVEAFFDRIGSADKTRRLFPDSYHLLLHDFDKAQVLECIEAWLLRHLA
jgi:alpha-beta hydrolase superfamily lysophospholipase